MSISVEFINPFYTAAQSVCGETLKISVKAGKPRLCGTDERIWKLYGFSAAIKLDGAVEGVMSISLPDSVALAMASGLAGERFAEMDDNARDAMGEVANLIIGTAKRELPGGLVTISPPTLLPTYQVVFPPRVPILILPFEAAAGRFMMQMAIRSVTLKAAA